MMEGQINSLIYDYLVTVDVAMAGEFKEENDAEPLEEASPKIKDMIIHFQATKRKIDFNSEDEIQTKKNKLDVEEIEEVQPVESEAEKIQAEETDEAIEKVEESEPIVKPTETEKTEAVDTEVSENTKDDVTETAEESEPMENVEEPTEEVIKVNSLIYDYLVTVDVALAGEFKEENDAEPLEEASPKIKDMIIHFQATKPSEAEKTEGVDTEIKENQNDAIETVEDSESIENVEEPNEEEMKVNKDTVEKEKEEFETEGRNLMNNWTKLLVSEMGKLKTLMDKGELWEKRQGEKIDGKSWSEMKEMAQGFRAIYGQGTSSGRDHQA